MSHVSKNSPDTCALKSSEVGVSSKVAMNKIRNDQVTLLKYKDETGRGHQNTETF